MNSRYSKYPKIVRAFLHSFDGLLHSAKNEFAFRIELMVAVIAIPVALVIEESALAQTMLIGSIFLVLIVELLNTGIEMAVDRVSTEYNELSKLAKDVASAAVLMTLINAAAVWFIIIFIGA